MEGPHLDLDGLQLMSIFMVDMDDLDGLPFLDDWMMSNWTSDYLLLECLTFIAFCMAQQGFILEAFSVEQHQKPRPHCMVVEEEGFSKVNIRMHCNRSPF